jgi:hypothetical protein
MKSPTERARWNNADPTPAAVTSATLTAVHAIGISEKIGASCAAMNAGSERIKGGWAATARTYGAMLGEIAIATERTACEIETGTAMIGLGIETGTGRIVLGTGITIGMIVRETAIDKSLLGTGTTTEIIRLGTGIAIGTNAPTGGMRVARATMRPAATEM